MGPAGPGGPGWGPWGQIPLPPKPGVIPLRPLNVGEIVQAVFTTIRYNFLAVYGPVLITGLGFAAALGIFFTVEWNPIHDFWSDAQNNITVDNWSPAHTELINFVIALGLLGVLMCVGYLALYFSSTLSAVATLRHAVVGRRTTLRQVSKEARPHFWRLVGATLLMYLLAIGGMLVAGAAALLIGYATNSVGAALGFGVILYIAGVIWGIYVQVRLVPLSAVVILEGARPVAAIRRAWRLNEGAWWRSLGISLLMIILIGVFNQIAQIPISLWASSVSGFGNIAYTNTGDTIAVRHMLLTEMLYFLIVMPFSVLVNLLTLPVQPLTQGLLYIDRRIRRESLDVQLAEEAGVPFFNPAAQFQAQPPQDTPPPPSAAL